MKISKLILIFFIIILLGGCLASLTNDKTSTSNNDDITETSSINNEIDFTQLSYIAFGDSITYGYNEKVGNAYENNYPNLVKRTLGLNNVYNYGIPSATLGTNNYGVSCISDNIISFNEEYDIISVMGGINDYTKNVPLGTINDNTNSTIYGALNVICKTLISKYKNSFIFLITPYKCVTDLGTYKENNQLGYNLVDVTNAIIEVGNKYDLPVLDLFNLGQFELEMYNLNCDGIHPSEQFYINYTAPQIIQFIKENYKK